MIGVKRLRPDSKAERQEKRESPVLLVGAPVECWIEGRGRCYRFTGVVLDRRVGEDGLMYLVDCRESRGEAWYRAGVWRERFVVGADRGSGSDDGQEIAGRGA